MEFSTNTDTTTQENKFISPGIHDVKIIAIDVQEPEGKAPYLNLKFENATKQTTDDKLYFSDAAKRYSETTLGDMKKALGVTETEITASTLAEFGKKLFKVIGNKPFRHRFVAEEIAGKMGDDGKQKNNWFKAKIGKRYSCEAISTNPSKLKPLDKANKYDWKMLPEADALAPSNGVDKTADLPF